MKTRLFLLTVLVLALAAAVLAADNPLVGTWEVVSSTRDGKEIPPPSFLPGVRPGIMHCIYSPDGYFMVLVSAANRRQNKTPVPEDQWTKEDWQRRYQGTDAAFGTYSVAGDKVTRRALSWMDPGSSPAQDSVWTFRKEGEDIVLNITRPSGGKEEERIRRMK